MFNTLVNIYREYKLFGTLPTTWTIYIAWHNFRKKVYSILYLGGLNSGKGDVVLCATVHFIVAGINRLHKVHAVHSFRRALPGACVCLIVCALQT
jgi:hypothetical protein